jgi:hypothetical protein
VPRSLFADADDQKTETSEADQHHGPTISAGEIVDGVASIVDLVQTPAGKARRAVATMMRIIFSMGGLHENSRVTQPRAWPLYSSLDWVAVIKLTAKY